MHKLLLLLSAILISTYGFSTNPNDSVAHKASVQPVLLNNFNTNINLSVLDKFRQNHNFGIVQEEEEEAFMPQDTSSFAAYINAISNQVQKDDKLVDRLSADDLTTLPVGIVKTIGVVQYVVVIDSVKYTATGHPTISAYLSLSVPESNKRIAFAGKGIEFHPGGVLGGNSTKLVMVSDHRIPLGQKVNMLLESKAQNNYIDWDCNGFKSINMGGRFEFSREVILPADENNTEKVSAAFEVNMTDFRNMMVGVSIDKFRLTKLKDISVEVNDAWMDFSDIRNPTDIKFPKDYNTNNENTVLWEGFYMKGLTIYLPSNLTGKIGVDKEIKIENAIIDNMGFSGSVSVEKLLSKENGNLENWPFSIEHFEVSLVKNRIKSAKMAGMLTLPLFKDDPLNYSALICDKSGRTDYTFTISPANTLNANLLLAKVDLASNSAITIQKKDNKFIPSANLTGSLTIKAANLKINRIGFQNLQLASSAPVIRGGIFSLGRGDQNLSNFPISISALGFKTREDKVILIATVAVNFMKSKDKGFSGYTTLEVIGSMTKAPVGEDSYTYARAKWKFERVRVQSIRIDVKDELYSILGEVNMYEKDSVYGTGFRGTLGASFKGINVEATALFGIINDTRYWYVDALVYISGGIPIAVIGPIGIYGFSGGMYYHMRREIPDENGQDEPTTQSGVRYVPDATTSLGFKAGVVLGLVSSPTTFNGAASFEMSFNTTGGVKYIGFRGDAFFMTPMGVGATQSPMYASLAVDYDVSASSFHGSLKVFVNYEGVLRGIGPNDMVGHAVIHFEPSSWYIHVGRPDQKVGINILGLAQATSYFMLGDDIPPFPGLPDYMADVAGEIDTNFMRNENMIASGKGIAFGVSLDVDTGKKNFLIFYGRFHVGLGFDIMLKDYGSITCAGRSGAIGMNGWYASGQAWAFLQGSVGVHVNLNFVKGEFDIVSFNAGAVLQAKLPNPTWVRGILFGDFNILGGLVKGEFNFEVTLGEECDFVGGSAVDGIEIIAELSPEKEAVDVSVFTTPQVAFNVQIEKPFELMDYNSNVKTYKVVLDYFEIYKGSSIVAANKIWNDNNDVLIIKTKEPLPGQSKLQAKVKVHWEEKLNGDWTPLEFEGKTIYENKEVNFTSGKRPDTIGEEIVKYNYPLTAQNHFYINESGEGYVQLEYDMGYLFPSQEGDIAWEYKGRFIQNGQPAGVDVTLAYSSSSEKATFSIPNGINKNKQYGFEIVKMPKLFDNVIDKNVTQKDQELSNSDNSVVSTEVKEIEGSFTYADEKILYTTYFATSKYATFKEKFTAIDANKRMYSENIDGYNLRQLNFVYENDELFDKIEIQGNSKIEPLIKLVATTDNLWFKDFLDYNIYSYYPANNEFKITWRTQKEFDIGIPPLKALRIREDKMALLTKSDWDINQPLVIDEYLEFEYIMSYFSYFDYKNLLDKAFHKYSSNYSAAPAGIKRLLQTEAYQYIYSGKYGVQVSYYLPGASNPSSKITTYIDY